MTQEPEPTAVRLARLAELATDLLAEVQSLTEGSGEHFVTLAKRSRANRRLIVAVIVGSVLQVLLTAAIGVSLVRVSSNAASISELTVRLDTSQTLYRRQASCPLYQVFLNSQDPKDRTASKDPGQYDRALSLIKQGYRALDCGEFNKTADKFKNGT